MADALYDSPAERRLFADAVDGQFDEHSLLEAALIACGVDDPATVARYQAHFAELRSSVAKPELRQIHDALHHGLLRAYDANATDLAETFDTGIYNCASATLLFVALASDFGLNANAVELPGHVRVEATAGNDLLEIEVTCPTWPDAVRRLAPIPAGRGQGEAAAAENHALGPAQDENGNRRLVSPLGLVAMIYYNRGIDAFYDQRYSEAVAANRRALLLDSANSTARGNLLAAVNNWALALSNARYFPEAESLLDAGLRFDPTHAAFVHNAEHVRNLLKTEAN